MSLATAFRSNLLDDLEDKRASGGTLEGVQVASFWLGSDTEHEGIYLGNIETGDMITDAFVPTQIKPGRQRYNADPVVHFTCQSHLAEGADTPDGAEAALVRVQFFVVEIVDAIQANPAMSQAVDWVPAITASTRVAEFSTGWAARCLGQITLHARLN